MFWYRLLVDVPVDTELTANYGTLYKWSKGKQKVYCNSFCNCISNPQPCLPALTASDAYTTCVRAQKDALLGSESNGFTSPRVAATEIRFKHMNKL